MGGQRGRPDPPEPGRDAAATASATIRIHRGRHQDRSGGAPPGSPTDVAPTGRIGLHATPETPEIGVRTPGRRAAARRSPRRRLPRRTTVRHAPCVRSREPAGDRRRRSHRWVGAACRPGPQQGLPCPGRPDSRRISLRTMAAPRRRACGDSSSSCGQTTSASRVRRSRGASAPAVAVKLVVGGRQPAPRRNGACATSTRGAGRGARPRLIRGAARPMCSPSWWPRSCASRPSAAARCRAWSQAAWPRRRGRRPGPARRTARPHPDASVFAAAPLLEGDDQAARRLSREPTPRPA